MRPPSSRSTTRSDVSVVDVVSTPTTFLDDKAAPLYLNCLDRMASLTEDEIPRVDAMAAELDRATGTGVPRASSCRA